MRLYIARHGQKASVDPGYTGGPNPPLTETGIQQADHLAEFLAAEGIDGLYSSCQLRSLMTAEPLAHRVDVPWNVWPMFTETSSAEWRGWHEDDPDVALDAVAWDSDGPSATRAFDWANPEDMGYRLSEIEEEFPDITLSQPFPWPDRWWEPLYPRFQERGYARLAMGLQAVFEYHDHDDHIAILCHGNIGDLMKTYLMDMPRRQRGRRFSFDNAGLSRLECGETENWWIVYANSREHLPEELCD